MCGIWAVFGSTGNIAEQCIASHKIRHRGPDCFRIENFSCLQNCCLAFHRLSIVDDMKGMQPLRLFSHPHVWLSCNGEIYNHTKLNTEYGLDLSTEVDGEPMIHLYERVGAVEMTKLLDGVFAYVILDVSRRQVILGRDTFGVKPLFRFLTKDGCLAVCSEAKGLLDLLPGPPEEQVDIAQLPPGHVEIYDLDSQGRATLNERTRFNSIGEFPTYKTNITSYDQDVKVNIANLLEAAVEKRLMAERRVGCLLSGGLDSSLVAALLVKLAKKKGLFYKIQTFSIGMKGSTDLAAARKVADHLQTEHHEVLMTPEEGLEAVPDTIYHVEAHDAGIIRASVPMYLLSKYIKENTDTTVVLSGEGSDELAQGYIHFHLAPSTEEADHESRRLLGDLYLFDVLRGDRATAAWGLEIRLPFLDHQFTSYYLSLDPESRRPHKGIEKYLLRSSFNHSHLLPDEILWRPKEGFSDGVSSLERSWIDILEEYCRKHISQEKLARDKLLYTFNPPATEETLYFREIFEKHYPNRGKWSPYNWVYRWSGSTNPSARAVMKQRGQE